MLEEGKYIFMEIYFPFKFSSRIGMLALDILHHAFTLRILHNFVLFLLYTFFHPQISYSSCWVDFLFLRRFLSTGRQLRDINNRFAFPLIYICADGGA